MYHYSVALLDGQAKTFTYCSEVFIQKGTLVFVPLRNTSVRGVVIGETEKYPNAKTIQYSTPYTIDQHMDWYMRIANMYAQPIEMYLRLAFPSYITKKTQPVFLPQYQEVFPSSLVSNPFQKEALQKLQYAKEVLLHGPTASGKTHVLLEHIQTIYTQGKQTVYLVPEIMLTPQFLERLQERFSGVLLYHSRCSIQEKRRVWNAVYTGECLLVVGSRSSLFLPWKSLELVIIDEAHEWTFDAQNMPYYKTTEIVHLLPSSVQKIYVTATPLLEQWKQAKHEKSIEYISLEKRLPSSPIAIVDMRQQRRKTMFSKILLASIQESLTHKKQSLIFINKRGDNRSLLCLSCGNVHFCPDCDIPLVHHKKQDKQSLICHVCFRMFEVFASCTACGSIDMSYKGYGTQQVEREMKLLFPQAVIRRADTDSIYSFEDIQELYADMKQGNIDILIGTQMITKGFDFPNLETVGILDIDFLLHIPDYQSHEKIFSLLTQVAGRSGRQSQGRVFIQTYTPQSSLFQSLVHQDHAKWYEDLLQERKVHNLPPFSDIFKTTIRHKDAKKSYEQSYECYLWCKQHFSQEKVSLAPALIPKIRGKYVYNVFIMGKDIAKRLIAYDSPYYFQKNPVHTTL